MTDPELVNEIRALYDAFNRRHTSFVTERMAADVTWPRAFKGGVVRGPEAVAAYWSEQWREIDPTVEPLAVTQRDDGSVDVEVHQMVRSLSGELMADTVVHHVYTFSAGAIASMQLSE